MGIVEVARVWGAAVPYMDDDLSAATAVRLTEQRLRQLHPHAMEHYDRLRATGLDHTRAMLRAAPFFTRDPNVRTGHPAPSRAALESASADPAEAARLAQSDFPHHIRQSLHTTVTVDTSTIASRTPVEPQAQPRRSR
ncbi:hypothetical protein HNP84_005936 [Thermocatellispora tengchongensis]|uniref:Uncharacterized protein n=1 Tax=Thermocatellispora tengchongensis TaxID=1073253 RepID=A0A840PA93_9ACTN|nr:hypothetical protein [Thermocatellispora tengchongensis]MBB5136192.1 hypothetical protein [Thermocatellispora tengchongensis]